MAEWASLEPDEMIRPEDCAELVRALLRLSPAERVPVPRIPQGSLAEVSPTRA